MQSLGFSVPDLAAAVTIVLVEGLARIRSEPAVAAVLAAEPDRLHPHLSFEGGDRFLAAATARLAPVLAPFADDPTRVAGWTVRLGLCLGWFPDPPVDPDDVAAVADLVASFVAPGLASVPVPSLRLVAESRSTSRSESRLEGLEVR